MHIADGAATHRLNTTVSTAALALHQHHGVDRCSGTASTPRCRPLLWHCINTTVSTAARALHAVLLAPQHSNYGMLCGVRHSSTSEAWLHLDLPLCDCIACDQPIKHSKAEVEGILHLLGLVCRQVTPLEDDERVYHAALHKEPEKVAPPFSAGSTHRVVGTMLIMQIHATHIFIINQNGLWNGLLLSLTCRQTNICFNLF